MTKKEALNTRNYLLSYLASTKANIESTLNAFHVTEDRKDFIKIENMCDGFYEALDCLKWVEKQIPKRELRHLRAKERTASRKREREAKSFLRDLTLTGYELVTE